MQGMNSINHTGVMFRKVNETYVHNDVAYDIICYLEFNVIDGFYDEQGYIIKDIQYRVGDVYDNFYNIKDIRQEIYDGLWSQEVTDIIYRKVNDNDFKEGIVYLPTHCVDIIDGIVFVISCYIKTSKVDNIIQTDNFEICNITIHEQPEIGYAYQCYPETKNERICLYLKERVLSGYYTINLLLELDR